MTNLSTKGRWIAKASLIAIPLVLTLYALSGLQEIIRIAGLGDQAYLYRELLDFFVTGLGVAIFLFITIFILATVIFNSIFAGLLLITLFFGFVLVYFYLTQSSEVFGYLMFGLPTYIAYVFVIVFGGKSLRKTIQKL